LELIATNSEHLQDWRAKTIPSLTQNLITEVADQIARDFDRLADLSVEVENTALQISADHLRKILEEVISNAFKFSAAQTSVRVIGQVNKSHFNLSVTNYGKGMQPEQIANLGAFMQFERQYEQQGSGLGLALTKQIVELYSGQLHIESIPDHKTIIHIILPILQPDYS
jgi:signal transduction histidine kinase